MKYHVFQHPMPTTKAMLKEKILRVWDEKITPDLIQRAFQGFIRRCQKVLDNNGGHQDNE